MPEQAYLTRLKITLAVETPIMMNDSIRLATLWAEMKIVKDKLDNRIIPAGGYLGIEDPELMIALEELSAKIQNHFERFRLVAEMKKLNNLFDGKTKRLLDGNQRP